MDYLIEYDYEAEENDELTVHKGDIVHKVKLHEDGWMIGVLKGKEGVFPSNFGKPLLDSRRKSQDDEINAEISEDNKASGHGDESESSGDVTRSAKKVTGVGFGNIFSGGKIQLKSSSSNHREGRTKSFAEEVKPDNVPTDKAAVVKKKEMAKVIHSYKAENADELNLEEGELITILDKECEDDGWWKGRLPNGQVGVFPDNFVELVKVPVEDTPTVPKPGKPPNKAPPPVLAAKPNVTMSKIIPPRPPQVSSDTKPFSSSSSTTTKALSGGTKSSDVAGTGSTILAGLEKEDMVSFDTQSSHKPLVGPNAGRAKRPGKKLPSNINVITSSNAALASSTSGTGANGNESGSSENITNNNNYQNDDRRTGDEDHRSRAKGGQFGSGISFSRESGEQPSSNVDNSVGPISSSRFNKYKENVNAKERGGNSSEKTTVDVVTPKMKTKEISMVFENRSTADKGNELSANVTPTMFGSKSKVVRENSSTESKAQLLNNSNSKSGTLPKNVDTDLDTVQSSRDLNEEVKQLNMKVNALEEENQELRLELTEFKKSSNDQINKLKQKINKLINEFDEEKAKRAASEVSINRLKVTIEDLEATMLSTGAH